MLVPLQPILDWLKSPKESILGGQLCVICHMSKVKQMSEGSRRWHIKSPKLLKNAISWSFRGFLVTNSCDLKIDLTRYTLRVNHKKSFWKETVYYILLILKKCAWYLKTGHYHHYCNSIVSWKQQILLIIWLIYCYRMSSLLLFPTCSHFSYFRVKFLLSPTFLGFYQILVVKSNF